MRPVLLTLCLWWAFGCTMTPQKPDASQYRRLGDSIATLTQQALLKNVVQAVTDSGFSYAIRYCNVHAVALTSALAGTGQVLSIQRLSDKNRNPDNRITEAADQSAFAYLQSGGADTLIFREGEAVYYKSIKIMMPTCLKCHGSDADLDASVAEVLKEKYPGDLARNYRMGDLRGMWKIVMKTES